MSRSRLPITQRRYEVSSRTPPRALLKTYANDETGRRGGMNAAADLGIVLQHGIEAPELRATATRMHVYSAGWPTLSPAGAMPLVTVHFDDTPHVRTRYAAACDGYHPPGTHRESTAHWATLYLRSEHARCLLRHADRQDEQTSIPARHAMLMTEALNCQPEGRNEPQAPATQLQRYTHLQRSLSHKLFKSCKTFRKLPCFVHLRSVVHMRPRETDHITGIVESTNYASYWKFSN